MAQDFLEEIYKEAGLLCELKQTVEYARVHDDMHTVAKCNELLPKLCDVCKSYMEQDTASAMELWKAIQDFSNVTNDLIFLGDILEYRIQPLLEKYIRQWGDIRTENEEGDYLFESTASGFLTIKDLQNHSYLHSTDDPMWEARKLADSIYRPCNRTYVVRGCGLGYLIYQLYDVSKGTVLIQVFEKDARMVEYARQYGVLDWVPRENLLVVTDENSLSFLESALEEDVGIYVFEPQLKRENPDVREALESLCIQERTRRRHQREEEINYWNNIRSGSKMVSQFDTSQWKKESIVVAAGPSLDDSIAFLREHKEGMNVVAVGTVFRKLIQAGILPDAVVILESAPVVYGQIEGVENQKVPLFVATTAYWKLAAVYQGEIYLIPVTTGFVHDEKEERWPSGGTVTLLALEAAIRFGAEKIYLVGADLSYPGGVTHAEGCLDRAEKSLKGMIPIEGVGGTVVYTDQALDIYRQQIESQIAAHPQITWYNLSHIGARIRGTVECGAEDISKNKK